MSSAATVALAINRIRAWRKDNAIPTYIFARQADLSHSAVRGIDDDDWNPTLSTIEKLEVLVPRTWQPGDKVPARNGNRRKAA